MKTLFTFQDSDAPLNAIDDIANTALNLNAHLNVYVVGLATLAPLSAYSAVPTYDWSASYTQIVQETHQKSMALSEHLNQMGVAASVIPICDVGGSIPGVAADGALTADFAIVPAESTSDDVIRSRFLEGVLFTSNTPTLLMPKKHVIKAPLGRVVIAWHPSPNTAAAVRSCLALLDKSTEVNITIVDPSPIVYGQSPGADIAAFLARHDIKATIDQLSSNGKPIGDVLVQHAVDTSADMLVMGAYGHSRFREWLLGGTTNDVFESLALPTLVSN